MAKLRLRNPTTSANDAPVPHWRVIDVAVDAPLPHLEGIYSYLADPATVILGSLVRVPYGSGESHGFVVAVRELIENAKTHNGSIKRILKVVDRGPMFDRDSLNRYQRIAETYGASLHAILALAIPSTKTRVNQEPDTNSKRNSNRNREPVLASSSADQKYLEGLFGSSWSRARNLILPPGVLWERVAISLFLANPRPSLILVPTERALRELVHALQARQISNFVELSSNQGRSNRSAAIRGLMDSSPLLVVGTRSAALAPFSLERLIILDPGDENYGERRSPYFRVDEAELWHGLAEITTLSHSRSLKALAEGQYFSYGSTKGRFTFMSSAEGTLLADLKSVLARSAAGKRVLINFNDKSFGTGVICKKCRNRSLCDCGFPLRLNARGAPPSCNACMKIHESYRCTYCGGHLLVATRSGGQALAATLAKSIRKARVIIANADNPKIEVTAGAGHTIVVATSGSEPRIMEQDGTYRGYDILVMIGGRAAFNSAHLSRTDRQRFAWSRLLGLANPKEAHFLIDLESTHPEFLELKRDPSGRGLEMVLAERNQLSLPPYSTLIELRGEDRVLSRLRPYLLEDPIFRDDHNVIFPVNMGSMIVKVSRQRRHEVLRLLQEMTRLRSAKRLPVVNYRVDPDHL